jgi:tetratricopeptide (TPR) repeat protein
MVGRNEPCYCGSGKKYKKCCLRKDENKRQEPQFSTAKKSGWIGTLVDWATRQVWYDKYFTKTLYEVFGKDKKEINEEEMKALSETVLFCVKVKDKKTPLELFIENNTKGPSEIAIYKLWCKNIRFGMWEVKEVYTGKGVEITNMNNPHEDYLISEHLGSYSMRKGDFLVARVLPFAENGWMFGGGLMARIPQSMVYVFRRSNIKFEMTEIEFVKIWFGKHNPESIQYKTYEQLKQELQELILKYELPFDMKTFDEDFQKATNPTVFFYPIFIRIDQEEKTIREVSDLVLALWKYAPVRVPNETIVEAGPVEQTLVNDFMHECAKYFEEHDTYHPAEQIKLSSQLQKKWLDTPQAELDNQTPRQTIHAERHEAGNMRKEIAYQTTSLFWPEKWKIASDLHFKGVAVFRKEKYTKAMEYYSRVIKEYPDFPFLYRTVANLGMTYVALGDKKEGLHLLKEALILNPNYTFPKEQIATIEKITAKEIEQTQVTRKKKVKLNREKQRLPKKKK